jgi:hypothetical protein
MKRTTTIFPRTITTTVHAALLGLSLLAGCGAPSDSRSDEASAAAAPAKTDTFVFASDSGTQARVRRTVRSNGAETLHGETDVVLGATARRRIVEDVLLDAHGRLAYANITVSGANPGDPSVHLELDRAEGKARMTTPEGSRSFRISTDAPWVYAPWAPGLSTATPVSAWVARRAATMSPAVWMVEPVAQRGWLVPCDQVALETEAGTTVVLGGDGADVDGAFVEQIRLAGQDEPITRVRGPELMF